jgi:hypothetical protein
LKTERKTATIGVNYCPLPDTIVSAAGTLSLLAATDDMSGELVLPVPY